MLQNEPSFVSIDCKLGRSKCNLFYNILLDNVKLVMWENEWSPKTSDCNLERSNNEGIPIQRLYLIVISYLFDNKNTVQFQMIVD